MGKVINIAHLKSGDFTIDKVYRVYVIEGDGCVLYVGQSKCAITRMLSHLGLGAWRSFFGSRLDKALIEPRSDDYTVTLFDEHDVTELISRYDEEHGNIDSDVNFVEQRLIYTLSPVFNAMGQKAHNENSERWRKLYPPEPIRL